MDTLFIVNPEASSFEACAGLIADAASRSQAAVQTSDHEGHAATLARRAVDRGIERLSVAYSRDLGTWPLEPRVRATVLAGHARTSSSR
ncbi:MAG: hypothetical protein ABEN55_24175, partial [Bradymonadaceae bacterium]